MIIQILARYIGNANLMETGHHYDYACLYINTCEH